MHQLPYRHTTHDALWSPLPSLLIHHCYPGGTNIVGATEPTPVVKDRSICSLDMRRMNRVLSLDKAAHTAVIEAGALGPDLEEQLHKEGFSLGHDPDSFEYSTLGAPFSHACRCPPHRMQCTLWPAFFMQRCLSSGTACTVPSFLPLRY